MKRSKIFSKEGYSLIWIVFRSQTEAMRCRSLLSHNGILGQLGNPPRSPGHPSCSWALRIGWDQQGTAWRLCAENGIEPCGWIDEGGKLP